MCFDSDSSSEPEATTILRGCYSAPAITIIIMCRTYFVNCECDTNCMRVLVLVNSQFTNSRMNKDTGREWTGGRKEKRKRKKKQRRRNELRIQQRVEIEMTLSVNFCSVFFFLHFFFRAMSSSNRQETEKKMDARDAPFHNFVCRAEGKIIIAFGPPGGHVFLVHGVRTAYRQQWHRLSK